MLQYNQVLFPYNISKIRKLSLKFLCFWYSNLRGKNLNILLTTGERTLHGCTRNQSAVIRYHCNVECCVHQSFRGSFTFLHDFSAGKGFYQYLYKYGSTLAIHITKRLYCSTHFYPLIWGCFKKVTWILWFLVHVESPLLFGWLDLSSWKIAHSLNSEI